MILLWPMKDPLPLHPDCRALLGALRKALKAKQVTYRELAKRVGVSEVTVKRWFLGKGFSLDRVFEICQAVDVSFFEVTALSQEEHEEDWFLTDRQELLFSKDPALFGFFKQLYAGQSRSALMSYWKISSDEFYRLIRQLEKMELLDVLPQNRVRFRSRGNIRLKHTGPLAAVTLRPQISSFLDRIEKNIQDDDVCMHSAEIRLSQKSVEEMVDEIHALGAKYRARALRDQNFTAPEKLISSRWLLAFSPFETNWRAFKLVALKAK